MKMTYEEIITTNYKVLEALSEEDLAEVIDILIDHYKVAGFPYFEIDEKKISREYNALLKSDSRKIELPNRELQQSMLGLATCNMFHPEMYEVKCNDSYSPMEIFKDEGLFRAALKKRIKYNDRNINPSCVRRTLSAFGGQAASNFRPSVARWVYQKFGGKEADVLDPCAGYGGRLMGAFCSNIKSYTGVDPNSKSIWGNRRLHSELLGVAGNTKHPEIDLIRAPFEDYITNRTFDLVFTSPPYFDTEKYSSDKDQSYIRYPTYDEWVNGFLTRLIENSKEFLKVGGYLVLNVGKPIDEDTLRIGTEIFRCVPGVYQLRLSKFLGQGNKKEVKHKYEPIYAFKKIKE